MKESEQMLTKMNSIFRILAIICIGLITLHNTVLADAKKIPYNLDSVAKALAENVINQIKQREVQNQYFRNIGAIGSVDFVIDMRKWHLSKESPALASSPFLSADQKNSLNTKLNGFYDEYRHPVYVVLSPIILGSNEVSGQAVKDVFDYFKIPWSDIEKLKEKYREYLKDLQKFKGTTSPVSGSLSAGAILTVESFIFYKSDLKEWRIRYGSDFSVSEDVKRANFVEDEYKKALDQNVSKFDFVGKRYTALDNYATTIISAFKNNCLSYLKQKELNDILTLNLAELNKPILIKVMGPKTWALEKRKFYLDPREQERYEDPLDEVTGGGMYFGADDSGYINLSAIQYDLQKASTPLNAVKAVRDLAQLIRNVSVFLAIWRSGEYSDINVNGTSKSQTLLEEAETGEISDQQLIISVVELRRKMIDKIQLDMLNGDELRVSINLLFSVQEALKYTFGTESLYPFPQIQDLKKIKTPALDRYKIEPTKNDEELLRQLKYLYENDPGAMSVEEIRLYFWLLCLLEKDCQVPVDLSKVQKINGKYPINAEEYAGRVFYFQVHKNPGLAERMSKLSPQEQEERKRDLKVLAEKYPNGVRFSERGFPDFYPYAFIHDGKAVEVDIKKLNPDPVGGGTKGSRLDMNEANRIMKELYPNWIQPLRTTWHHIENSTKLLLVPTDIHQAIRHNGGRSTNFSNDEVCEE